MKTSPIQAIIDITDVCNQKCLHCFSNSNNKEKSALTLKEIKNSIDQLYKLGVMAIGISGGEPLMHPDFFEIIDYTHQYSNFVKFDVFTNGVLWTENDIFKYKKYVSKKNYKLRISFDGYDNDSYYLLRQGGKNDFGLLVRNLEIFDENDISYSLQTSLTDSTSESRNKIIDFALNHTNASKLNFIPVFSQGRALKNNIQIQYENWSKFVNEITNFKKNNLNYMKLDVSFFNYYEVYLPLKEKGDVNDIFNVWRLPGIENRSSMLGKKQGLCQAGGNFVHISYDGEVYPCTFSIGLSKFSMGNIRNNSIEEMLENSEIVDFFQEYDVNDCKGNCSKCEIKTLCGGGCRIQAFLQLNDLNGIDNRCYLAKKDGK